MSDQTKNLRSRGEQLSVLTAQIGDDGTFSRAEDTAVAGGHILEAEARGAAEARASDAEAITALEARVKELEAQLAKARTPHWYFVEDEESGYADIRDAFDDLDQFDVLGFEGCAVVQKGWAFTDRERKVHEFATEAEAEAACAALAATGEAP